ALASTFGGLLPRVGVLWPSLQMAEAIAVLEDRGAARPLAAVGYAEPSLVFLLGNRVQLLEPAEASRFLAEHADALVWVREDLRSALESASDLPLHAVALVNGWNLSKGRMVRLVLLERAALIANPRATADKLLP